MQVEYSERTKITAEDSMILTNGETYGRIIFLSNSETPDEYYEIPLGEYYEILAQIED